MKIFNLILALIFFAFAAVQFNDTPGDILFWVLLYTLVATVSAFGAFNKYNMWILMLGIAAAVYEMFRKFPAFAQWCSDGMPSIVEEMKASSPYVELVREFFGLVLCLAVLIFHYIRYTAVKGRLKETDQQARI